MSLLADLVTPINSCSFLSAKQKADLLKNDWYTLGDVLSQFPLDYENRNNLSTLHEATSIKKALVKVQVIEHKYAMLKRKGRLLIVIVDDGVKRGELHCYGRNFMSNVLTVGKEVYIWGNFTYKLHKIICSSFEIIQNPHTFSHVKAKRIGIIPRYRVPIGFSQITFSNLLKKILNNIEIPELHPYTKIGDKTLMNRNTAVHQINFPSSPEQLEEARERFAFDEVLLFQIYLKTISSVKKIKRKYSRTLQNTLTSTLSAQLPFELTRGQINVINSLQKSLSSLYPMTTLLQGDVGSGKTLVALFCAIAIVEYGEQVAFAVPSESLAIQHYTRIKRMCEPLGLRITLLTGSTKKSVRKEILESLETGIINIIVGTHALYSQDVNYKRLGFIIIDEQHRFGVHQRMAFIEKGTEDEVYPDVLLMSATPIPRSLALTIYGDMEIVTLKERPAIQQQVETRLVSYKRRQEVYQRIIGKLEKNEQAFFVFPQIEESDDEQNSNKIASIEKLFSEIEEALSPHSCAMLHSKLSDEDKVALMEKFEEGTIRALIATTIIEVGIDIPQATTITIFNAERFGLSTLHQLRGRVGRGELPGEAILIFKEPLSDTAKARLKTMYEESDGFIIAEEDMKLRGPGDIHQIGVRQSGALLFQFSDVFSSVGDTLLKLTLDISKQIIEEDPQLVKPEHSRIQYIVYEGNA